MIVGMELILLLLPNFKISFQSIFLIKFQNLQITNQSKEREKKQNKKYKDKRRCGFYQTS